MPQINQLSPVSQVSSGDQIPVYAPANGDARKMSVNQLLQYFQQTFASPTMSTNIYTPTTGFNISVPNPAAEQQWLSLQPTGPVPLATGTITLPLNTITLDGAEVLITSTQQITALTILLNGATNLFGINATSRLNAGGSLRLRYIYSQNSWYNITNSVSNPDIGAATGTSLALSGALSANTVASNTSVSGVSGTFTGTVDASALTSTTSVSSATLYTSGSATIGTTLNVTGLITGNASILANSSSSRVGYGTSAGGAVLQATNKSTAVTLNNPTGQVTMNNAALNAGVSVSFDLNSTSIFANDIIVINYISGAADPFAYTIIGACQSGKAVITVKNISAGNLSEAIVFKFAIIAGDV